MSHTVEIKVEYRDLQALIRAFESFNWTVVGGIINSGQGTREITVIWDTTLVVTSGTVSVRETIGTTGCDATSSKTIIVNPKPSTSTIYHN